MDVDLATLGQSIKRAQWRNHRTMDAALRPIGVTLVQWDALRAISRMPAASGHDLAVASFQSDQSFGALALRLLERGLITRTAGRGRRIEHALTDAGRALLQEGVQVAEGVLGDLFAGLDRAQRSQLSGLLSALAGPA